MKKQFLILLLVLIVAQNITVAQHFQFSQYNFTTTRVNPGWLGLTKYASIDFDYRNQKTGGDFNINSNFFSIAYPLLRQSTGTPWSGLGVSFLDDRSGGIFKTQEMALSYALNIPTGKYESLSLGFRGLMRAQRIDYSGLFTGSQYIEGRGFDPSTFNGESGGTINTKYYTFSTGLLWNKTDRRGSLISQLDGAIFDFNKPNNSFIGDDSHLSSTWITHGTFRLNKQAQLTTYTDMLLTYSAGKGVFNVGARWQYDLSPTSRTLTDKIDFITRYVIGRSGIVGIQLHNEKLSLGLSYDFPIVIKNYGNTGAFEIGLEYRTPVSPPNRGIKNRRSKRPATKKQTTITKKITTKEQTTIAKKTPTKQLITKKDSVSITSSDQKILPATNTEFIMVVENDSTKLDAQAKAGKIVHEPLIVEKITLRFHFEYNSIDLDDETEKFLNELAGNLTANENLKLKITGHTDNRGNEKYNQHLSLKRAEEIKKYLSKIGIDSGRIITEGKGMSEPLNGNNTEEDRAKNRRVEINVYYDSK